MHLTVLTSRTFDFALVAFCITITTTWRQANWATHVWKINNSLPRTDIHIAVFKQNYLALYSIYILATLQWVFERRTLPGSISCRSIRWANMDIGDDGWRCITWPVTCLWWRCDRRRSVRSSKSSRRALDPRRWVPGAGWLSGRSLMRLNYRRPFSDCKT